MNIALLKTDLTGPMNVLYELNPPDSFCKAVGATFRKYFDEQDIQREGWILLTDTYEEFAEFYAMYGYRYAKTKVDGDDALVIYVENAHV